MLIHVLLLYVPSQKLWSWQDGQFTLPHFFLGKLEQAVHQYRHVAEIQIFEKTYLIVIKDETDLKFKMTLLYFWLGRTLKNW